MVGELMGAHLLLHAGRMEEGEAVIGVDNQAAMRALLNQRPRGGHYLLDEIHTVLNMATTRDPERVVGFRWVPAHVGIEGNETVDTGAKNAAGGTTSQASLLPKLLRKPFLPHSKSATRKGYMAKLKNDARRHQDSKKQMKALRQKLDRSFDPKKYRIAAASLPRRHASLLIQLRSGHIGLNAHLHRIGKRDSPRCTRCAAGSRETVEHFLMFCPEFWWARKRLREEAGHKARNISWLLSSSQALPFLFRYIARTGRFEHGFGDVSLSEEWVDPHDRGAKKKKDTNVPANGRLDPRQRTLDDMMGLGGGGVGTGRGGGLAAPR